MDGPLTISDTAAGTAFPGGMTLPNGPPPPSIYRGTVAHKRMTPFVHELDYKVFSVLLDIDRLEETAADTPLFSYNKPGVLSFHDRDHGPRDGSPLRPWLNKVLHDHGFDLENCPVRLLTFPRLWGFVFNPLSIYYCYDRSGRLAAILYEVSNTFGEWHGYLLPVDPETQGPISQRAQKVFHVSPFMPVDGAYHFTLSAPAESLSVLIRYQDEDGDDRMIAKHTARRSDLTGSTLAGAIASHPLMTLKVIGGIHWEALKLWEKGARFHPKPDLPRNQITG